MGQKSEWLPQPDPTKDPLPSQEDLMRQIEEMKADAKRAQEYASHIQYVENPYELERKAGIDSLLGIPLRGPFLKLAHVEAALVTRQTKETRGRGKGELPPTLTFIVIDLDEFKGVNDTYGHAAGDKALIGATKFLQEHFGRTGDLVARAGGDELWVLASGDMQHVHDWVGLTNGVQYGKLQVTEIAVTGPDKKDLETIPIIASFGLAAYTWKEGESIEDAVKRTIDEADLQVLKAKAGGKHR